MSTWPNRGASGGPCGGLEERKAEQPKQSDHVGLTQANRPPRNPVRFSCAPSVGYRSPRRLVEAALHARRSRASARKARIALMAEMAFEARLPVVGQRGSSW